MYLSQIAKCICLNCETYFYQIEKCLSFLPTENLHNIVTFQNCITRWEASWWFEGYIYFFFFNISIFSSSIFQYFTAIWRFCFVNHKKLPNIKCFTYKFPCDFARLILLIFDLLSLNFSFILSYLGTLSGWLYWSLTYQVSNVSSTNSLAILSS